MPTHDEVPAWEVRGERPPFEEQYEREAERLRFERARAWRERKAQEDARRARNSVPPPPSNAA